MTAHACAAGCGSPVVAQWQRRPTADELATLVATAETRHAEILAEADPEKPPVFGPLPTVADSTMPVYACANHAIDLDLAARIHAADCAAPHPDHHPGCDCTPEPLPEPEPLHAEMVTLPTGWIIPAT